LAKICPLPSAPHVCRKEVPARCLRGPQKCEPLWRHPPYLSRPIRVCDALGRVGVQECSPCPNHAKNRPRPSPQGGSSGPSVASCPARLSPWPRARGLRALGPATGSQPAGAPASLTCLRVAHLGAPGQAEKEAQHRQSPVRPHDSSGR
jgi:hypothetical protein